MSRVEPLALPVTLSQSDSLLLEGIPRKMGHIQVSIQKVPRLSPLTQPVTLFQFRVNSQVQHQCNCFWSRHQDPTVPKQMSIKFDSQLTWRFHAMKVESSNFKKTRPTNLPYEASSDHRHEQ